MQFHCIWCNLHLRFLIISSNYACRYTSRQRQTTKTEIFGSEVVASIHPVHGFWCTVQGCGYQKIHPIWIIPILQSHQNTISTAYSKTTVTPLLRQWSYCSLPLSCWLSAITKHHTTPHHTNKPYHNPLQPELSDHSTDEAILLDTYVNEELLEYVKMYLKHT